MSNAREDKQERVRLNRFDLEEADGVFIPMLDIRFWKNTKTGPKPTKRGVAIKQSLITDMIVALQKVRSQINSEQAREEAGVR
jgi:hypothetical protein